MSKRQFLKQERKVWGYKIKKREKIRDPRYSREEMEKKHMKTKRGIKRYHPQKERHK